MTQSYFNKGRSKAWEKWHVFADLISLSKGQVIYLLFLSRGWLSFEDAGIHRLNVLHHQAEELVAETKYELEDREWGE